MTKPMMLKNGTQVFSGRNFWAKANEMGETTQLTFMTGMNPALTVAFTWWKVRAPAMMAMEVR
jgi:carbamoylphosphate synthase small subunit